MEGHLRGGFYTRSIVATRHKMDLEPNDEIQEVAHEFEIDLNCVVITNHRLTLEGIDNAEEKDLAEFQEDIAVEDYETIGSTVSYLQRFYEDLRRAAHLLALVGLVTRFQHWIQRFVEQLKLKPD